MMRFVLSLLAIPLLIGQQNPPAKFRSVTDAVRVDVRVRQGSRPITGLTTADFELRDTGVVQDIQAISAHDVPLTLLLALDTSSCVEGKKLEQLKAAGCVAVYRDPADLLGRYEQSPLARGA